MKLGPAALRFIDGLIRGIAVMSFSYFCTELGAGNISSTRAALSIVGPLVFAVIWLVQPFGKPEKDSR